MVQIFERGQYVKTVHCVDVDDAINFVRLFNALNNNRRAILAY